MTDNELPPEDPIEAIMSFKMPPRRGWRWVRHHLLPPYAGSSRDTILGIEFDENPLYAKPWFRRTIGVLHMGLKGVDDACDWVRFRSTRRHRHHIVYTDLKPGWHDIDEVMFRACFTLLGRYVEGELGRLKADEDWASHRGYRLHCEGGSDEASIDLWLWYSEDLRHAEDEEMADYCGYTDRHGYDFIDKEKDAKLRVLIEMRYTAMRALLDLRSTLWT